MSYKLNDWSLSDVTNVTPKIGDEIGSSEYVIFDVPDLSVSPFTYISQDASSTDKGNSVEIVADLSDVNSGSYLTMYIDDGTNRQGIKIYNGKVTLLDGSSETIVDNPTGNLHRYTITLKEGHFEFVFDKQLLIEDDSKPASAGRGLIIGFPEEQSDSKAFIVKFKYIKYTEGVYKYIVLENTDFELQLDSAPTFNTVNLHTYTKSSFDTIPTAPKAWDPLNLVCGNYIAETDSYDGHGLVTAATILLPQKPDMEIPNFFYRVRFTGDYTSDYSAVYFNNRSDVYEFSQADQAYYTQDNININELPGYVFIFDASDDKKAGDKGLFYTVDDHGFHQILALTDLAQIHLPESRDEEGKIIIPDNWKITFRSVGKNPFTIYSGENAELFKVTEGQVVSFQFDTADGEWVTYIEQQPTQFNIHPDVTNEVFKAVYGYHLPADQDDVYTKSYDSGVAATLVRAESRELANVFSEDMDDSSRVGILEAPNDLFTERWGNIFQFDKALFKNQAEMRDILQTLVLNMRGEMLHDNMETVIEAVTGAKPTIIQYKDKVFNTLWSSEDIRHLPDSMRYYLYDGEHPSFSVNPFILYGGNDKAYTFQINIYDPYDLQYDRDMVQRIVQLFKPGWTKAVTVFYDAEGHQYQKKYYYGIDNYGEAAYNK